EGALGESELAELGIRDAAWAGDDVAPDYAHLGELFSPSVFSFTAADLERLCGFNRFDVTTGQDEVLFGLRGCRVSEGTSDAFSASVSLAEDVPDHVSRHCVLGVWRRSARELAVFPGSTVPNWRHMEEQRSKGGQRANMLPTGRYQYTVGTHRAVEGAFILPGRVVVLRSNDDLVYETTDDWEEHAPADNIHPGFSDSAADYSSAGCQTVPGSWSAAAGHTGAWARFRRRAGMTAHNRSRWGDRYVYILLTGREARLATTRPAPAVLTRLRFGSTGPDVQTIQMGLSISGHYAGAYDGDMGPGTVMALIRWMKDEAERAAGASLLQPPAEAIVTPEKALALGLDMIAGRSVATR
ncbi:MAG TPA: hypothetical protein VJB14_09415, partial [Planctomycetota bacterium]|nr:hypothetical protein [Planctomycetota bacterium]